MVCISSGKFKGSSQAAVCALKALQSRLEQLELERERAFEESSESQCQINKEVENLRHEYERKIENERENNKRLQAEVKAAKDACDKQKAQVEMDQDVFQKLREQLDAASEESAKLSSELALANESLKTREFRRMAVKSLTKKAGKNVRRRPTLVEKFRQTYGGEAVPFILPKSSHASHSLTANVQTTLRSSVPTDNAEDGIRSLRAHISSLTSTSTKLLTALGKKPSVKAYQKILNLLTLIDAATSQLNNLVREKRKIGLKTSKRACSPNSQRAYDRKLRMLTFLRDYKKDLFCSGES